MRQESCGLRIFPCAMGKGEPDVEDGGSGGGEDGV